MEVYLSVQLHCAFSHMLKQSRGLANFRLLYDVYIDRIELECDGSTLQVTVSTVPEAIALLNYLTNLENPPYPLPGLPELPISPDWTVFGSVLSLTTTTYPPTPPTQAIDCDSALSGAKRALRVPVLYCASVDEITDQRIKNGAALESRNIDIEGRWVGSVPPLLPTNLYTAALLSNEGVWVQGSFQHIPRLRSRLGLESYFGIPLLGVFNTNRLTEVYEVGNPVTHIEILDAATDCINYPGLI